MTEPSMKYRMIRTTRPMDLDTFCRTASLHPEFVRRLVALGLLEPDRDARGDLLFDPPQLVTLARIQRLRAGLGLNYAAIGVVIDLLDRVAALEGRLRTSTFRSGGGSPWTPTG